MWIRIDSKPITITTVLWSWSHEFAINNAILMQVQVVAVTPSTTFDVRIEDVNSNEIYNETNIQWILNELVNYPVYSNQTIYIENSSIDENFTVILTYRRA